MIVTTDMGAWINRNTKTIGNHAFVLTAMSVPNATFPHSQMSYILNKVDVSNVTNTDTDAKSISTPKIHTPAIQQKTTTLLLPHNRNA